MLERYIHHLQVERPLAGETAVEARERLREKFPRAALRRMTHLGMLVGSTLENLALRPDDALVYATSFAETRALEDFLTSFPTPSPLLFQTSIHPGGVQQVLIGRQQPIARLWPLAGRARLVEQALLTALLETAPRVVLIGGEERGTWLLEQGLASESAFAFGLLLTGDAPAALGRIAFAGGRPGEQRDEPAPLVTLAGTADSGDEPCPSLEHFVDALAGRRPLAWRGGGGMWSVTWQ